MERWLGNVIIDSKKIKIKWNGKYLACNYSDAKLEFKGRFPETLKIRSRKTGEDRIFRRLDPSKWRDEKDGSLRLGDSETWMDPRGHNGYCFRKYRDTRNNELNFWICDDTARSYYAPADAPCLRF